jgi:hypothetical protein
MEKYTKDEIIKKLRKEGFEDLVKYDSKGVVSNYQLDLAINKTFK